MLAGTSVWKISYVACGFSSVKIHYSVNIINEVYVVVFFSIKYHYSDILLKKKLNFIYSILWNVVIICFSAVELVIVLAWFL